MKQHELKWRKLRIELIKRPLLINVLNLPFQEIKDSLNSRCYPKEEIVSSVDNAMKTDRETRIINLQPILIEHYGERGSVKLARHLNLSDTTTRPFFTGKWSSLPSYDTIFAIELLLNYQVDYPLAIEHLPDQSRYLGSLIRDIQSDLLEASDRLKFLAIELNPLLKHDKHQEDSIPFSRWEYKRDDFTRIISAHESEISTLKEQIELLFEDFIKK